jgi:hypothetical protein
MGNVISNYLTYSDVPAVVWLPPDKISGWSLVGTPCALAKISWDKDFPTFLWIEYSKPMLLSSVCKENKHSIYNHEM